MASGTDLLAASANALFPDGTAQAANLENMSKRALSHGLDLFSQKKFDEAIRELRRAVGLSPISQQAVDAYNYIAQSYLQKKDTQAAIRTYQQSLRLDPSRAETHSSLGRIYYAEGKFPEALAAYGKAVKYDPSAANRYALGQAYLANGQYDDAERQFQLVRNLEPGKPNGDYGMGQVYAKQGRATEAISAFDRALALKSNFWLALSDKGYALADSGEIDQAKEVAQTLEGGDPTLAGTLNAYIAEQTPAKMTATYATGTFRSTLGAGTAVSSLGLYLTSPNGVQTFSMVFQFDKEMDTASVQNIFNWTIARSTEHGMGKGYNFDLGIPSTEVTLPYYPKSVSYNPTEMTATVLFNVQQNATANGTIDPAHIQFTFKGQDLLGHSMDPQADQYTGFSGFA